MISNNSSAINTNKTNITPVGLTWSNSGQLNIDLDDLMGNKKKNGPAPSMNQLKSSSNNTSPVHAAGNIINPISPITPTAISFPAGGVRPQSFNNIPANTGGQAFTNLQQSHFNANLSNATKQTNFNQFDAFQ